MRTEYLEPSLITARHQVRTEKLVGQLTEDMKAEGWNGRPLLILEDDGAYIALTGSHRIAAAIAAGLEEVPTLVIETKDLTPGQQDQLSDCIFDYELLAVLQDTHLDEAINLMWHEGLI